MKVEREIAGIALPFAAGIMMSICLCTAYSLSYPSALSIPLPAVIAAALFLMRFHENIPSRAGRFMTISIMAACGWICGATASVLAVSELVRHGWLECIALDLCRQTENVIDSIPFDRPETGQIIKALLTGERSGIPEDVTNAFRASGASHILALSGLHLGIIYGILRGMLSFMGNSRRSKNIKGLAAVLVCGFYSMATGAGPSITRAFIFIAIREYARFRNCSLSLPVVLMSAMMIQLVLTPGSVMDIGFQLSYAAIAGIAYIFPFLRGFWPGNRNEDAALTKCARWIWDSAAMSISCQITTGPLTCLYFGSFPTHFILTNMIALPLTGMIIPAALLTTLLHWLGWSPEMILKATEWLVTALSESLDTIASM